MIRIEKADCCGCSACAGICPQGCIVMKADEEGFLYPYVDRDTCIHCGLCERACPVLRGTGDENAGKLPNGYAAVNENKKIRAESSSGGVFSLLAEQVIREGGIVFGAAMSVDCRRVVHIGVDSLSELKKLRGSKYVQSSIGDSYTKARKALDEGRRVLFTGTPCQIEGLYGVLGKKYDNLVCMDFICHGVPSPKVWEKYVAFREEKAEAAVRQTFFRHKKYGWKTFAVLFIYTNNTAYVEKYRDNLYMKAFLGNYCLRPACYKCHFKKLNRISDITVADYWGIQKQYPKMDDDGGTSLVLIHTDKGKNMLKEVTEFAKIIPVDVKKALKKNRAMTESAELPSGRAKFMADLDGMEFDELVKSNVKGKYSIERIINCFCRYIKRFLWIG